MEDLSVTLEWEEGPCCRTTTGMHYNSRISMKQFDPDMFIKTGEQLINIGRSLKEQHD
jgi:hypothetical protein